MCNLQGSKKLTLIRYLWGWCRQLTDELEVSQQQTSTVKNSTRHFSHHYKNISISKEVYTSAQEALALW